jgi:16S rRNA C967 or C1407 C5-methylase (RsmB/RsmF family)
MIDLREKFPSEYVSDFYYIKTFPHKHQMDGSFAVALRKKFSSED